MHPTKSSISRGPRIAIPAVNSNTSEQAFDLLAGTESDDRLLPVGSVAHGADSAKAAAPLAPHAHRVDVLDLDALRLVLLLESLFDVRLGGLGGDAERITALRVELVGALGDDRADHDLGCRSRGHSSTPSAVAAAAAPREAPLSGRLKFSSRRLIQSLARSRYVYENRSRTLRLRARMIFAPGRF